jgi:hypothetical protein
VISSSAAPPLPVCSPDNGRDEVSLPPPTGSYSKLEWRQRSIFPDALCSGRRPRNTNNGKVAYSLPNVAEMLAVVALRKAVLRPVCLHRDSYVTEAFQEEDLLGFCRSRQSNEK